MNRFFPLLIVISIIAAAINGRGDELTAAVLNEPCSAVELCIYLCGGMCFWGGIMRIAERSGLTARISAAFSHIIGGLFPGLDKKGRAFTAITMNMTANMLGLGNAATPLGIEAMKAIAEEEHAGDRATPSMVMFTVMNTASITLIPSTAMTIRQKYGCGDPADIILAVWAVSAAALTASLMAAWAFSSKAKGEKK